MSLVTCRSRSAKITPPSSLSLSLSFLQPFPYVYNILLLFRQLQLLSRACVCAVFGRISERETETGRGGHVMRLVFQEAL